MHAFALRDSSINRNFTTDCLVVITEVSNCSLCLTSVLTLSKSVCHFNNIYNSLLTLNSVSFFFSFLFLSASPTIPTVAVLCFNGSASSSTKEWMDDRRRSLCSSSSIFPRPDPLDGLELVGDSRLKNQKIGYGFDLRNILSYF